MADTLALANVRDSSGEPPVRGALVLPGSRAGSDRFDGEVVPETGIRSCASEKIEMQVGRYTMHSRIASGGMATVHLGMLRGPVGFARAVAIKRLHSHYARDPQFVASLLDEARLTARIRHRNVVSTLDLVTAQDEVFVVMEFILGESLAELVRASSRGAERPSTAIAASIIVGALHGLHAAHETKDERGEPLGLVHRDVSPHNILVGVDGAAHLIDFGVAKARGRSQVSRDGEIKGKLGYMPPEQLLGRGIDRRADVFAAATVLWETLAGRRLFQGVDEGDTIARVLHGQVEPPSRYAPSLSPAIDAAVLRGLSRDPEKRFATAREMALAIEACTRLAPASEVAAWVDGAASPALRDRARRLEELEHESSSGVPHERDRPALVALSTPLAESHAAPLSPADASRPSTLHRNWRPRRLGVVLSAVGMLAALATVMGASASRVRDDVGRPAAESSPVPALLPARESVDPEGMILPIPIWNGPQTLTTVLAVPSTPERRARPRVGSMRPSAGTQAGGAAATVTGSRSGSELSARPASEPSSSAAPQSCDPPFYYDSNGIKRYHRHCANF